MGMDSHLAAAVNFDVFYMILTEKPYRYRIASDREFGITGVFDAPCELPSRAHAEVERLKQW
jgi:hypothetical protein